MHGGWPYPGTLSAQASGAVVQLVALAAGFDRPDEDIDLGVVQGETFDAPNSWLDLDDSAVGPMGALPSFLPSFIFQRASMAERRASGEFRTIT